jgi:hypothetical protein
MSSDEVMELRGKAIVAVLTEIATVAEQVNTAQHPVGKAKTMRDLAEAYAWLENPNQPHASDR